ncbi:hypothetical protein GIB67_033817 [Kingdonia uniflora]|uniref:DUF6570 domain-containing protein n=1 Tax=Kingdonia uniflora TaxID=39325 RepID=A0A7J7LIP9_9MAGN|nr:hypothetical protein GIB67_033817 [Kingdonia uniflora]
MIAPSLPCKPYDLSAILIVNKVRTHGSKEFRVRREYVRQALTWLKQNHIYYVDIHINSESLQELPEDGVPENLPHVQDTLPCDHNASSSVAPPQNDFLIDEFETAGTVANAIQPNQHPCITKVLRSAKNDGTTAHMPFTTNAIDEFPTPRYIAMVFPALFLYVTVDLRQARLRRVNPSDVYIQKDLEDGQLSIQDIKEMLSSGNRQLVYRISYYAKSIRRIRAYWFTRLNELTAMVAQALTLPNPIEDDLEDEPNIDPAMVENQHEEWMMAATMGPLFDPKVKIELGLKIFGTSKSTLISAIVQLFNILELAIRIMTPTGVVACNIGGVFDSPLYVKNGNHMQQCGSIAYTGFEKCVRLSHIFRQSGDDQACFRDALGRLSYGTSTMEDWELLHTRDWSFLRTEEKENFKHALRLFPTKIAANDHNQDRLIELGKPIARIPSTNNCDTTSTASSDDAKVVEIVLSSSSKPPNDLPLAIMVDFDNYRGTPFYEAEVMKSLNIPKGVRRVLFRTLNTDRGLMWKKEFDTSYVGFMKDGAKWLVENTDIKLVDTIAGEYGAAVREIWKTGFKSDLGPLSFSLSTPDFMEEELHVSSKTDQANKRVALGGE